VWCCLNVNLLHRNESDIHFVFLWVHRTILSNLLIEPSYGGNALQYFSVNVLGATVMSFRDSCSLFRRTAVSPLAVNNVMGSHYWSIIHNMYILSVFTYHLISWWWQTVFERLYGVPNWRDWYLEKISWLLVMVKALRRVHSFNLILKFSGVFWCMKKTKLCLGQLPPFDINAPIDPSYLEDLSLASQSLPACMETEGSSPSVQEPAIALHYYTD
jgi:hypothetical protein